jgi:hypothetical protein
VAINEETRSFVAPTQSASAIAKSRGDLYDCFALPCTPTSFIPNPRLQGLLAQFESSPTDSAEVCELEFAFRNKFVSSHAWQTAGGSETNICNPNLLKLLECIRVAILKRRTCTFYDIVSVAEDKPLPFPLVMASSASKPEGRIEWDDFVLIATEAKGVNDSQYQALIQGMQVGGDSAVQLWQSGLSTEQAVVPVILSYSDCLLVFAVYLLPRCFPVIVQLSPPLSYLSLEGRLDLARWCLVLATFAVETMELKKHPVEGSATRPIIKALYLAKNLFFKPLRQTSKLIDDDLELRKQGVSTLRTSLEFMMLAYRRIAAVEESSKLILFPLGVVSYPSKEEECYKGMREQLKRNIDKYFDNKEQLLRNGCPVVVYRELQKSEGWQNRKPCGDAEVESYVASLEQVVHILNEAGVAHMDLRPANIMWRMAKQLPEKREEEEEEDEQKEEEEEQKEEEEEEEELVEMQVIDLEDATPFGCLIDYVETLRWDPRYPVSPSDERNHIAAAACHNDWFGKVVAMWARDARDDKATADSFTDFMRSISKEKMLELLADTMAANSNSDLKRGTMA